MATKLTAKFIVAFDGSDHVLLENGEVVFEDNTILYVGREYPYTVSATIDFGNAVISPGFVDLNALGDISPTLLDCWQTGPSSQGLVWSRAYFESGRKDVFTAEEEASKRRYAVVQLLLNGITTCLPIASEAHKAWAESYAELWDLVTIAEDLGIRAYLGPSFRSGVVVADGPTAKVMWDDALGAAGLAEAQRFLRDLARLGNERIRGMLAPACLDTMRVELLEETKRASERWECPVRIHAAQTLEEVRFVKAAHGSTPIALLHDIGFLGKRTLIPHARFISGHSEVGSGEDELAMLRDSETTVIYCPLPSARYGLVLESFDRYREAGIKLGLGTDTFPPDMIRAIEVGSTLTKAFERNYAAGAVENLFRAATIGGAAALGRDDLGRIAPGAKADMITMELDDFRLGPVDDPIRTLAYNGDSRLVTNVIIDGRFVVRDRVIDGVDLEALRHEAQRYFDKMKLAYSERDYLSRSVAQLFPTSFKMI